MVPNTHTALPDAAAVVLEVCRDEGSLGGGLIAAPLPLAGRSGLPVHLLGHFALSGAEREVPISAPPSGHAAEAMRAEWNAELVKSCAAAAYAALLTALKLDGDATCALADALCTAYRAAEPLAGAFSIVAAFALFFPECCEKYV